MARAKTHKAGYYLCKSTRVAEPVGKTSSITTSSELDSSAAPQHQLDTEYRELTLAPFQPGQKITNKQFVWRQTPLISDHKRKKDPLLPNF